MKTIIIISVLVLSAFTKTTINPDHIRWSKDFKLTKEHFQLAPPNEEDVASAFIKIGVAITIIGDDVFIAHSFMVPKESYLIVATDKVLNHEKRHFDLAEYIARCMNLELVVSDSVLVVNIFDKYYSKLDSMQNLYDFESHYYIDGQLEWDAKIDSLLTEGAFTIREDNKGNKFKVFDNTWYHAADNKDTRSRTFKSVKGNLQTRYGAKPGFGNKRASTKGNNGKQEGEQGESGSDIEQSLVSNLNYGVMPSYSKVGNMERLASPNILKLIIE